MIGPASPSHGSGIGNRESGDWRWRRRKDRSLRELVCVQSLSADIQSSSIFRDRSSIPDSRFPIPNGFWQLLLRFGASATGDRPRAHAAFAAVQQRQVPESGPDDPGRAGSSLGSLKRQLTSKAQRVPPGPLPVVSRTPADFSTAPASGLRVTWFGHATTLIEIDGHRVLVDPVWGERISPSQAFGPKRFHPAPMPLHVMPRLDAIVLTHDHYDHLDMYSIGTLVRSVTQEKVPFIMPLGVGAHLERWGVPASRIIELDWWETAPVGALTIAAGSARHFSGRGLTSGNRTLWASWSIIGPTHRVFHSGDTGPFDGLADNGRRYGPYDVAFIKIGAYDDLWPDIHLTPEQAVRACTLVQGKLLFPDPLGDVQSGVPRLG
jgi:L-ascorbate metabolism protein UlaG (beta-lactamase superfamily)